MIGYHEDGRRKYKSFYARTQRECKEKVRKYREDEAAGLNLDSNLTFGEWADEWYKGYEGQVSPSTYDNYRYTIKLLKEGFGEQKLTAIKPIHVENFLKRMAKEGRSQSSLAKLRGMMFQIMKKAVANDLIRKNPVEFADRTKVEKQQPSTKDSFTAEEVERLMLLLPDNRIGHSIRLMIGTGMRTQELLALEPRHIAPDGSSIQIEQAVTMVKGTPQLGPPKTQTSYRDIPVPEKYRPSALFLRDTDQKFVWHGEKADRFCNPSSFRKQYKAALEELGGVRMLSPHCCRHTYVSQLQAHGVPLETIMSLTGHSEIAMTNHYLHVQPEVRQNAVATLNQFF
jgi:integrase